MKLTGSGVIYGTSLIRFINVWAGVGGTQEAMCLLQVYREIEEVEYKLCLFGDRTSVVWWSGRYHPVFKTTLAGIYL